jgi:chromosome segregation ATPase
VNDLLIYIKKNYQEIQSLLKLQYDTVELYIQSLEGSIQDKKNTLKTLKADFEKVKYTILQEYIEEHYQEINSLLKLQYNTLEDYLKSLDGAIDDQIKALETLKSNFKQAKELATKQTKEQTKKLSYLVTYIKENFKEIHSTLKLEHDNVEQYIQSLHGSMDDKIKDLEILKEKFEEFKKLAEGQDEKLSELLTYIKENFKEIHSILTLQYDTAELYIKSLDGSIDDKIKALKTLKTDFKQAKKEQEKKQADLLIYINKHYQEIRSLLKLPYDTVEDYLKSLSGYIDDKIKALETLKTDFEKVKYTIQQEYIEEHYQEIHSLLKLQYNTVEDYLKSLDGSMDDQIKALETLKSNFKQAKELATKRTEEQTKKLSYLVTYIKENFQEIHSTLKLEHDNVEQYIQSLHGSVDDKIKDLEILKEKFEESKERTKQLSSLTTYIKENFQEIHSTLRLEHDTVEQYISSLNGSIDDKIKDLKTLKEDYLEELQNYVQKNYAEIIELIPRYSKDYKEYYDSVQKDELDCQIEQFFHLYKYHQFATTLDFIVDEEKFDFILIMKYFNVAKVENPDECFTYEEYKDYSLKVANIFSYLFYVDEGYKHIVAYESSFRDFFEFIKATNQPIAEMIRHQIEAEQKRKGEVASIKDYRLENIFHTLVKIWYDTFVKHENYFDLYYNLKNMKSLLDEKKDDVEKNISLKHIEDFYNDKNHNHATYLSDTNFEKYSYLFHRYVKANKLIEKELIKILKEIKEKKEISYRLFLRYIIHYLKHQHFISSEIKTYLKEILEHENKDGIDKLYYNYLKEEVEKINTQG